jgi:hypothetical protein
MLTFGECSPCSQTRELFILLTPSENALLQCSTLDDARSELSHRERASN